MSARAATKINWGDLFAAASRVPKISAGLVEFKKSYDEMKRELETLQAQKTEIDFNYYKSALKNKNIVDKLESTYKSFNPIKYNHNEAISIIEQYEKIAVNIFLVIFIRKIMHKNLSKI